MIKRVTYGLAVDLRCGKFKVSHEYVEDEEEKLLDDVEAVTIYSYLDDIIYSGGGCQAVVTVSQIRMGRIQRLNRFTSQEGNLSENQMKCLQDVS